MFGGLGTSLFLLLILVQLSLVSSEQPSEIEASEYPLNTAIDPSQLELETDGIFSSAMNVVSKIASKVMQAVLKIASVKYTDPPEFPNGPFALELCPESCSGHGQCLANTSETITSPSGAVESHPFYCECNSGYIGESCAIKNDGLLAWYMSKGVKPLPPCCGICDSQLRVPKELVDVPATLRGAAQVGSRSSLAEINGRIQREHGVFSSVGKMAGKALKGVMGGKGGRSEDLEPCCIYCGSDEPSEGSSRRTGRDASQEECCSVCPIHVGMSSPLNSLASNSPRRVATSSCCTFCASQFWIPWFDGAFPSEEEKTGDEQSSTNPESPF